MKKKFILAMVSDKVKQSEKEALLALHDIAFLTETTNINLAKEYLSTILYDLIILDNSIYDKEITDFFIAFNNSPSSRKARIILFDAEEKNKYPVYCEDTLFNCLKIPLQSKEILINLIKIIFEESELRQENFFLQKNLNLMKSNYSRLSRIEKNAIDSILSLEDYKQLKKKVDRELDTLVDFESESSRLNNTKKSDYINEIEKDLETIKLIQMKFTPDNRVFHNNIEFYEALLPSKHLTGDFIDFFAIDKDHTGFYMADVAGHGIQAGLVSIYLRSFVNQFIRQYWRKENEFSLNPAVILKEINRELILMNLGRHITMFYGIINSRNMTLSYSNGGQFPLPVYYDGKVPQFIEGSSYPVGIFDFAEFENNTITLADNFTILLVSDGLLEIIEYEELKEKKDVLLNSVNLDSTMPELLEKFNLMGKREIPDDVTIMLIKKRGKS